MAMIVNNNTAANNAYRNLNNTQNALSKSMEKLSSGLRINRAADDAAGLAISQGLKAQVNGSTVAARNIQDGISVVQTAEGALGEVQSILQRMRDLAVQGGNDSNNAQSRLAIQGEADALGKEIQRITDNTNFNGTNLLDATGGTTGLLSFQVGTGDQASDVIKVQLNNVATDVGTLASATGATGFDVTDAAKATLSITAIDDAIVKISTARADLGAVQNRFESAGRTNAVSKENLSAAASRITDVDMAEEMVSFTRSNILSQAGTAMLSQANQSSQSVLKLLG
ncbi:flagellin [Arthrobacter polaris]|uniref:flagellin N-terminal helical domain-containing protein n=1 Tax=Arthrobacter polaris TaxID=2813727 RepID=UPI001F1EC378|nr:flagellin [Arthrobacter polaris]UIK88542.1 flagellin [Arthrobacter polaris]